MANMVRWTSSFYFNAQHAVSINLFNTRVRIELLGGQTNIKTLTFDDERIAKDYFERVIRDINQANHIQSQIDRLSEQMTQLQNNMTVQQEQVDWLHNAVLYAPSGTAVQEAKEHFAALASEQEQLRDEQ